MNCFQINRIALIALFVIILSACGNNTAKQTASESKPINKEQLENINQYLADKDKDIIESYIRRQGWNMSFSPDGYFYEIYADGTAPKAANGKQVEYEYTVSLMNGTECYTSSQPKAFVVGHSDEPSGLHLAITRLGKGGQAKFIFPPQLAYGLQGDGNKIPPRSVVIYDVKVIDIKDIE